VRHFREHFDTVALQVIRFGDDDAGFCRVSDQPDRLVLETIELLPAFQQRGIGSELIRALQRRALDRGVPVMLQVLKSNARAKLLYERLGFFTVGEPATHHQMQS